MISAFSNGVVSNWVGSEGGSVALVCTYASAVRVNQREMIGQVGTPVHTVPTYLPD